MPVIILTPSSSGWLKTGLSQSDLIKNLKCFSLLPPPQWTKEQAPFNSVQLMFIP